jgi:hypothetical protein
MAVTIHVNGSNNSLAHKGCSGFAKNTPPDVCKTPSPGGPVPIPYPVIVSMASDLTKGTKTVKVDGGNMAAIKGSELSRCSGDEPGTVGGVVSNTNMKEAKWILYSFDVKLEGKNACRLSDKLTMNHGNTACLAGWIEVPVIPPGSADQKIACAIYCCDQKKYTQKAKGRGKKGQQRDCARLGSKKHNCVKHALRNDPKQSETGIMTEPRFPSGKGKKPKLQITKELLSLAKKLSGSKAKSPHVAPDIVVPEGDGHRIVDAKFPCPPPKDGKDRVRLNNQKCESDMTVSGINRKTPKELQVYPELKIDGKKPKDVSAVSPKDAKEEIDKDPFGLCKCEMVTIAK